MADDLSAELQSLRISRDETPREPRRFGPLLGVLSLGVVGLLSYQFGWPYLESKVFKAKVRVTEIALVSPAQASVQLTSTGYVVPERSSKVAVQVQGRVKKLWVQRGQAVEEGQLLFELDVTDQKATIMAAQSRSLASSANVETAKANLAEIQVALKRARGMAEQGVSPKSQAEDLEARSGALLAQVKASEAQARAANAEVQALSVNLGQYVVKAPLAGTILNKPPEVGEYVGPQPAGLSVDMGNVEIADLKSLVVESDVAEQRLSLVKLGGPCEIVLDAYPGRRFKGKALEIIPRVNRSKATVVVKVGFVGPTDGVMPDMAARVSFLSEELTDASLKQAPKTIVPGSALAERNGSRVVFVVSDGQARQTTVRLGPAFGDGFELASGPAPGTRVVKEPAATLVDGQKIQEEAQ